jgi:hypothetical protein
MANLYVKAFGLSFGIVASAISFAVGTLNILVYLRSGLNWGYKPTLFSVIFNSILCFAFAFCAGSLIAWLYNRIVQESKAEIDEKIKMVARSIWESKGKPEGTSADDWKEAEKRVKGF